MTTAPETARLRGERGQRAVVVSVVPGMITVGIVAACAAFSGAAATAIQAEAGVFG
jgi:hypothetical protein